MANGRAVMANPPAFTPLPYGLLSTAQDLSASPPANWQAGVKWQSVCPEGGGTYDPCLTSLDGGSPDADPPVKSETAGFDLRGATPFAVYARMDCSAPGFWDRAQQSATEALTRVEGVEVERIFDSGIPVRDGTEVTAYPHLRATAGVVEADGEVLQTIAEPVSTEPLDIVEGLDRLEAALASCYFGQGVLHVPAILANDLANASLVTARGNQLTTTLGNRVSLGVGYSGASPAGVQADSVAWVYATGAVFYIRSEVTITDLTESFDRSNNTLMALAERRYLLGWDCCHLAVPIYVGGIPAGAFGGAGEFTGGS